MNEIAKCGNSSQHKTAVYCTTIVRFFGSTYVVPWILVQSNLVVWVLQALSNAFLPVHRADAFRTLTGAPRSAADAAIRASLVGFSRWDSQHLLHVALYGYTFETNLPFFPFVPCSVRIIAFFLRPLMTPILSDYTILLLIFVIINHAAFVLAGCALYRLTVNVFRDEQLAQVSVVLFAINPASIFFRSCYTESMYSCFTFLALCFLTQPDRPSFLRASLFFALASCTRSNGLLNILYVSSAYALNLLKPLYSSSRHTSVRGILCFVSRDYVQVLRIVLMYICSTLVIVMGLLAFQFYAYRLFCCDCTDSSKEMISTDIFALALAKNYTLPCATEKPKWCSFRLPFSYSYVQSVHWDVGFLKYWRWRKIPLFLLSLPIIMLIYLTFKLFFNSNRILCMMLIPSLLHLLILAVVGIFFINVEVTTRLIFSSCPVVYWFCASLFFQQRVKVDLLQGKQRSIFECLKKLWESNTCGRMVLLYYIIYGSVGSVVHSAFYPWT
ncbi:unnamed protein product [Soboliphyme baturini]|uniref:GPI mannosyltransferase 2 n=1 Tax=Soboliphyme baturini TaxID=241478 RepID=A0A183IYR3_9BILA|nr:unnamed protein product [Soboliphyme baturini]